MNDKVENVILEHLRAIRADIASLKETVVDQGQQIIGMRKQMNSLEADSLRHDERLARIELRLDRIEKRLDLVDA
jgi:septal ring factor EnvC (AmiA/AmiB activator)